MDFFVTSDFSGPSWYTQTLNVRYREDGPASVIGLYEKRDYLHAKANFDAMMHSINVLKEVIDPSTMGNITRKYLRARSQYEEIFGETESPTDV